MLNFTPPPKKNPIFQMRKKVLLPNKTLKNETGGVNNIMLNLKQKLYNYFFND